MRGVSGNPGGRPRGRSVLGEIEAQIEAEGEDGQPLRVRLVEKLIQMAMDGDLKAMELLLKRLAPERLAFEGEVVTTTVLLRNYTGIQWEKIAQREREGVEGVDKPLALLEGEGLIDEWRVKEKADDGR